MTSILPAVGLHRGVSFADYQQWDAINISRLKPILRSPLHCRYAMDHPREVTESILLGSALHTLIFEPAEFDRRYFQVPKFDKRTKDGRDNYKSALDASLGKALIDEEQMEVLKAMGSAVASHALASKLSSLPGECELSMIWTDEKTSLHCKGRIDKLAKSVALGDVIVELKTTRDASPCGFPREVSKYGYETQAAYYVEGIKRAIGSDASHVVIAVENEPPYAVATYMLDDLSMQSGKASVRRCLDKYAECVSANLWPGYDSRLQLLQLPHWAIKEYHD